MEVKKIRTADEVQQDKREREREEFKKKVSGDMRGVFDDVFKPLDGIFKPQKKVKKKKNWFLGVLKWLGILFLALFIINFILGNIWVFKKLLEELFGI